MSCDILVALHKLQQNPEQTIPIHPIGPPSFSIENNNIILMGNVMAGPGALPPSKWSSSISQPYLNIKYALIFGACPGHCHISPHIHNITIQSQQQQKKKRFPCSLNGESTAIIVHWQRRRQIMFVYVIIAFINYMFWYCWVSSVWLVRRECCSPCNDDAPSIHNCVNIFSQFYDWTRALRTHARASLLMYSNCDFCQKTSVNIPWIM